MGFDAEGQLIRVAQEEQPEGFRALSSIIKFSPRQVRLKPGESQVIRVLIKRPSGIPDGEYRSHLEIRVLPDVTGIGVLKKIDPTIMQGGVVTRIGVTLPVIWRSAQLKGDASVANASFTRKMNGELNKLKLKVTREGLRSVFGDIVASAEFSDGEQRVIAKLNDYGIYHPYDSEDVLLNVFGLELSEANEISKLHVKFINDEVNIGSDIIFEGDVAWSFEK